ncbi:MAG: VCBS repeat-containing protein [Planctomycetes bacterium]|nr:VCBS repeat-containing protein [Planctomycetota bacterium]
MLISAWLDGLFTRLQMRRRTSRRRAHENGKGSLPVQVESMEARVLLTMQSPIAVTAGTSATAVIIADLNADGNNDIVQLNSSVATVSVLRGNGDGTFQAAVTSAAGGTGTKMAIADFNHDGKLDLVTNQGGSIDLLVGNGDGTFQIPSVYPVGAYANDVEIADVNEDGFDDVLTASFSYGGTTQLFLNSGLGSFLPVRNLAIGPSGLDVEAADVNGDGHLDLIQSSGSGYVGEMLGHGDGTFGSISYINLGMSTNSIQVADFNQDGQADLVASDGASIRLFTGNGVGGFQADSTYNVVGATELELGDLNGDSHIDVVTNAGTTLLGRGSSGFYAPTVYGTAGGTAIALGDLNGDGGLDSVAVSNSAVAPAGVTETLNAKNDLQLLAGATHLSVTTTGSATAGTPFAVTVTALDDNGQIVTNFQGTVGISGAAGTAAVSYTFSLADGGVHTIANAAKLFTAGAGAYSVSSPFLPDASGTVTVVAAPATKFSLVAQATSVAGEQAQVTVSGFDAYGNFASTYVGTVHFTSSDLQAVLPADYTFTAADAGTHTFVATLKTAGSQTLRATDATSTAFTGVSGAVLVTPAAAVALSVTGGSGYIGSSNAVQVTAVDAFGNVATGDNQVVHLATSDAASSTSADAALTNGKGTFAVTPLTLGTQTLTATELANPGIQGSEVITVTPGWGTRYSATALTATVAGQTQTTTLTVYDAFGNISTVYSGWIAVATTDPQAPLSYVYFSPADAGVKDIPVTLYTAGTHAVTLSDYANSAVTLTQTGLKVTPAAPASVGFTTIQSTVAGTAQNFTVTIRDAYGNAATDYRGTIDFSSTDSKATLPASYTFTAADAGTHSFTATFASSGGQSLTVTDASDPLKLTATQKDFLITTAALNAFQLKTTSATNATAGQAFNLTISATDAFGNVITDYTGTALFTSTDAQASVPASYVFTAADAGEHVFSVALKTAGSQSITVTDSANSAATGTLAAVNVKAAAASTYSVAVTNSTVAGTSQPVTVTVQDAYGNKVTNYSGTVKFLSSDAQATLPANYSFSNKDSGVHTFNVTFRTPGTQTLTVTDTLNAAFTKSVTGIVVTPSTATVSAFSVSGFPATTAGVAHTFTVSARDAAGNVVTGYVGTVKFSSSDVKAGLPASYTFTAADAGVHVFSATLKTAGTQSLSVIDSANSLVVGTQSGIVVSAGAATQFSISAPTSVTQGVGFKITVSALDAFGNVATGYLGKVQITTTDAKGGSQSYTFSSKDKGVHVFSLTFSTLGLQTLTVVDTANSLLLAKTTINVAAK